MAKTTKKATKNKTNELDDLLGSRKTETKKASKSSTPVVNCSEEIAKAVDEYALADIEAKKAEATKKAVKADLTDEVFEMRDNHCFEKGFTKSIKLRGKGHNLSVIWGDKFKINPDNGEALMEKIKELGGNPNELIHRTSVINVESNVLIGDLKDADKKKLKDALTTLESILKTEFSFSTGYTPAKDENDKAIFCDREMFRLADGDPEALEELRELSGQYAPTYKVS